MIRLIATASSVIRVLVRLQEEHLPLAPGDHADRALEEGGHQGAGDHLEEGEGVALKGQQVGEHGVGVVSVPHSGIGKYCIELFGQ